jgi:hypothetical protein
MAGRLLGATAVEDCTRAHVAWRERGGASRPLVPIVCCGSEGTDVVRTRSPAHPGVALALSGGAGLAKRGAKRVASIEALAREAAAERGRAFRAHASLAADVPTSAAIVRVTGSVSAPAASTGAARPAGATPATRSSGASRARAWPECRSAGVAGLSSGCAVRASASLHGPGNAGTACSASCSAADGASSRGVASAAGGAGTTRAGRSGRSSRCRRTTSAGASCAPAVAAGAGSLAVTRARREARGEGDPKRKPVSPLHSEVSEKRAFHELTRSATGADAGCDVMEMSS